MSLSITLIAAGELAGSSEASMLSEEVLKQLTDAAQRGAPVDIA